jgi:hypothetical protein
MRFRPVRELAAARVLEAKPPDPARVLRWLETCREDLRLARDVLAPESMDWAYPLAYEAGLRACIALLNLAGYRVTNRPGHHAAAIEGAAAVLGPAFRPLLRRLDTGRRFRNEMLYGDPIPASEATYGNCWKTSLNCCASSRNGCRRPRNLRASRASVRRCSRFQFVREGAWSARALVNGGQYSLYLQSCTALGSPTFAGYLGV